MKKLMLVSSALTISMVMAMAPVLAADVAPPEANSAATESDGIADIIVTASRRETNLQKTAIPITALTAGVLGERGVQNVTDITKLVPAVKIGQLAGSGMQVTIRGIGNFGGNSFAEPGVTFNLDGVYVARSSGSAGILYDVSRVEVLKGPQGTLYGRNSTGGVISLITRDPGDKLGFNFSGEYGNKDRIRVEGGMDVPIAEGVSLRVAGQRTLSDGFTPDGNGSEDNYAGRVKLKIAPTSELSILLEADYTKIKDGVLLGGFDVPGYDPFKDIGSGPTSLQNTVIPNAPPGAPYPPTLQVLPKINNDSFNDNSSRGLQGTVNYDFGTVKSTLIVANRWNKAHYLHYGAGFPVSEDTRDNPSEFTTAEFRLASDNSSKLKWVVGTFYFDDDLHSPLTFDQGVTFQKADVHVKTKSYAGFAEGTYSMADTIRLTAGGRYTTDRKRIEGFATGPAGAPFAGPPQNYGLPPGVTPAMTCPTSIPGVSYSPIPGFGPNSGNPYLGGTCTTPILGKRTFSKFTWKVGAEIDLGPRSLLYATVSTGFKSGGFYASLDTTGISSLPSNQRQGNSYEPETLTAYTIGTKNRFLDNTLQLNLEGFYWRYKNKQFAHLGIVQPSNGNNLIVDNAGAATVYGAELEALWQPTHFDNLNINIQYLHTEYTNFKYTALFNGPRPATACSVGPVTPGARFNSAVVDCSGRPVSLSPKWTINLGYDHTFDLGSSGQIIAGASTQITSSFYAGDEFLAAQRQKSVSVSNAQLTWRNADGNLSLTGFIKNIEKSQVLVSTFVYPFTGGVRRAIALPTTYGARVSFNF